MSDIFLSADDNMGAHNRGDILYKHREILTGTQYKDLSTIIVTPTRGGNSLSSRWMTVYNSMIKPMNQKVFGPLFVNGMEVGEAYNSALHKIFEHEVLSKCKYMITLEDDVLPPEDGFLKLYEGIEKFDVVGGLYYGKGEMGWPMIYGDIDNPEVNWQPQEPKKDKNGKGILQQCYGAGMGFNIFKLDMFKNIEEPWFHTLQTWDKELGVQGATQDIFFFEKAHAAGFTLAIDGSLKCGHFAAEELNATGELGMVY